MLRRPSRQALVVVRAVRAGCAAALVVLAVVLILGGPTAGPGDAQAPANDLRCAGAAGKSLVRTADGVTRAVPFEHGWAVYRGERPGTLLVVCPD